MGNDQAEACLPVFLRNQAVFERTHQRKVTEPPPLRSISWNPYLP